MRLLKSELEILVRELERQSLLSVPAKIRFMESKGFKDIEELHDWMRETSNGFRMLVENLKERAKVE